MSEDMRTADEWSEAKGIWIMDPDGWRAAAAPAWDEPIPEDEFDQRARLSTIGPRGWGTEAKR